MWRYLMILMCAVQVLSDGSSKVRVMTYNIRTASEWAKFSGGDMRAMRTWDRRIKSVARTIMIAKPHVIGTQEGLGTQLDELENYLSDEYKQYKGLGRLGGVENDDDNSSARSDDLLDDNAFGEMKEKLLARVQSAT